METLTYIRSSDLTKEPKLFNGEENVFLTKVSDEINIRKMNFVLFLTPCTKVKSKCIND